MVVPLTMPISRWMRSPASDSRSGRMSGMPPPTDASNSRSRPADAAAWNSSEPTLASSSLLAVITGLPALRASRISERAGSMPPMTSTTTSTPASSTTDSASWVRMPSGMATPRSLAVLRTATRASSRSTPVRVSIASASVVSSCTRPPPTLPQPNTPTRTGAFTTAGYRAPAAARVSKAVIAAARRSGWNPRVGVWRLVRI